MPRAYVVVRFAIALTLAVLWAGEMNAPRAQQGDPCDPPIANPILCENTKPGNPASEWDVSGAGDSAIQGFATQISVNQGQTIRFKVKTTALLFRLDIYRLGYYGGLGARKVATIGPVLRRSQPNCLVEQSTGLVDCGNWSVTGSWSVPATAVSGIYIAKATRLGGGGGSHIVFVVRDDDGQSDLLFQTSDTTWQAYNQYGGNSLYVGNPAGRAYKVSYNRPFTTRGTSPEDWLFGAEYPMVRWLEANGYDVSYSTGIDSDRRGAEILEHKVFLSVGHDEYWSAAQRMHVENARAAGVHLAFFSGNEVFWKTRWENSIASGAGAYRTLVCYKETHANAKIDPVSNIWTGTWRDPRFSPPADGGHPENALTGTIFAVNSGTTGIRVPAAFGKLRFWRNTSVAELTPGAFATMPDGTLGYEWDEDRDNGFRPPGLIRLSNTTVTGVDYLQDYGSTYGPGTGNHALTLYKHPSGALVFGAGTVQWSWGLDDTHYGGNAPPSLAMQQATLNLFADMGAQPGTMQPGLVPAVPSSDSAAPVSAVTSPAANDYVAANTTVTITGTAADSGGGNVGGVEVSVDGAASWRAATGGETWSYAWQTGGPGVASIVSRAVDDSGNLGQPSAPISVTVGSDPGTATCPCSIWAPSVVPASGAANDPNAVELGTRFRADQNGYITAIRFYKAPENVGPHIGNLWTAGGTLLASVSFTGESGSGWQEATLASPVAISANTSYVVSYHTSSGFYNGDLGYFASGGVDNAPLHALQNGQDGPNGVYKYGASGFPNQTFQSASYWADVVFVTSVAPDTTPPSVTAVSPSSGASAVSITTTVTATFSENVAAASVNGSTFQLRDASNVLVPATVSYSGGTRTATLMPSAPLAYETTYTARVVGGAGGVEDLAGNPLAADFTWSFTTAEEPATATCPCSIWDPSVVPASGAANDPNAVEVGTRFRADQDGYITAIRFYKAPENVGPHAGNLWAAGGTLLASVSFTGESGSGWQEATLPSPVAISANTSYVVSYHTSSGFHTGDLGYFASGGVDNAPLHALQDGQDGPNGVYKYGASGFPNQTFQSANYWVDVVFVTSLAPDTTPPAVTDVSPSSGASGVAITTAVTATFSENVDAASVNESTFELRNASNVLVPATVSYSAGARTATLTPSAPLAYETTYTARVVGGVGGVQDLAGNPMAADFTWSFTTAAAPPPPPTEGPGGPILAIGWSGNPFSRYYAEILRAEGLNAFTAMDISQVSATVLAAHDVVILGEMPLTSAQVTMLTNWVDGGGNLIAMRPTKSLAGLLGLSDSGGTLPEGYLAVDTNVPPGAGITAASMQYHGVADRYTVSGASTIATLYADASTPTVHPAVTLNSAGGSGGEAAAFTYDLAKSIIYTRQGNPAWSGQERDGFPPIRSDDLYFGGAEPDWVDFDKIAIPQADEQQRLLANLINHMNIGRKPLPRFWYFPRGEKAAVVMTGDDHANNGTAGRFDIYKNNSPAGCNLDRWECVRGTSYIYPHTPISNAQAASYVADGFEIAVHITTGCSDYTPQSLQSNYTNDIAQFSQLFPSLPAPTTNRTHCIAFSDYDTQPQVALDHGIRLDTNYYYWPASWVQDRPGFMTGSGMPMRFASANGAVVDVYQAATQLTDESDQSWPFTIDTLLDRAIGPQGYYGFFVTNMHTDTVQHTGSDAIVASALARSVPIISAEQLLTWLDGRNESSFGDLNWSGGTLSFSVSVGSGANGIEAMLPITFGTASLTGLSRNGSPVTYRVETIKGVAYAMFAALQGNYQASYGTDSTPPVISGIAASPTNTTATITWATNELATSRVDYGTSPGDLSLSASTPGLTSSHEVTLTGLSSGVTYYFRVTSVDAANNPSSAPSTPASFTTTAPPSLDCPCTIWPESTVPGTASDPDTDAVELGVKFRTTVDGVITGIRFYKGPLNTGVHIGTLWSASGVPLATVTFTDETSSGWQQMMFDTPVPVTANTVYLASYHAPNGRYAVDVGYFASSGAGSEALEALANGVSGGNGVYQYGPSTFPTQTFNSSNYWVDVVFVEATP
ncbi:MAG: DUF4082 domain-containing protein [Luteitalea sp.]|nr:DUF4082 domain-containing protein [Luteitalea sp.]